jgi:23S rRNA pseudouridine1911/1915/1917 synthase
MKSRINTPEILFEDNHLLVAIKPAGVLSQSDISGDPDMLTLLKEYLKNKYNKPGEAFLGLLHRLDRPVSGVMVFAKTSKCASRISAQIRNREVTKLYRAIVKGSVKPDSDELHGAILKDEAENKVTVFEQEDAPDSAKEARLRYVVIGRAVNADPSGKGTGRTDLSLLRVELLTGRSHQIRAQLAYAGYPILGDRKYDPQTGYSGDICLESYSMTLRHPVTNETMVFNLPLRSIRPWGLFAEDKVELS